MRTIGIVSAVVLLIVTVAFLMTMESLGQSSNSNLQAKTSSAKISEMKVNVFFGTNKVMNVEELRTNAVAALRMKGHTVPESSYCVINVQVQGKQSGCAVMFFDFDANMNYTVVFNAQGEVENVQGGKMRHSRTPGPGDPRPKMPEGGVRETH